MKARICLMNNQGRHNYKLGGACVCVGGGGNSPEFYLAAVLNVLFSV